MAFELPSVGFKEAGGIVESIDDGVTGFLCDPGDIEQLGGYTVELIKDADLRKKMGTAGRKRVEDHFLAIDRTADIQRNILEVLSISE